MTEKTGADRDVARGMAESVGGTPPARTGTSRRSPGGSAEWTDDAPGMAGGASGGSGGGSGTPGHPDA